LRKGMQLKWRRGGEWLSGEGWSSSGVWLGLQWLWQWLVVFVETVAVVVWLGSWSAGSCAGAWRPSQGCLSAESNTFRCLQNCKLQDLRTRY